MRYFVAIAVAGILVILFLASEWILRDRLMAELRQAGVDESMWHKGFDVEVSANVMILIEMTNWLVTIRWVFLTLPPAVCLLVAALWPGKKVA